MTDQARNYAEGLKAFDPGEGIFSPGVPQAPPTPQPVRYFDFNVGVNNTWTPRTYEPFSFAQLRAFANVEPVRLAIETRKDQIERLSWQIKTLDGKRPQGQADANIRKLTRFLRKPDGVTPFAPWLRMSLEDLMVLDAPAWERRRTRAGELIALEVVPGDTIKPMVDSTGRRPLGPGVPAYQQVIKGRIWADLTNEELIYAPRNPRPNHQYGMGPVEQIVVTIMTVMKRQAAQLAYFTEGNIPAGLIQAAEGWSPDQLKVMQDWMNATLSGNTADRAKLVWVPFGSKYTPLKDSPLKDDFDEWLYRIVAFAFNLPPTPFVRQMNKGTAGEDQERGLEEGVEPIKLWAKRVLDGVIQDDFGFEDLEFAWNTSVEVAPDKQAKIDDEALRNGSATIDEIRDRRGEEPLADGLGSRPMVYTPTGPLLLEQVVTAADKAVEDLNNPPEPAPTVAQNPPQNGTQGQGRQEPHNPDDAPVEPAPQDQHAAKLTKRAPLHVSSNASKAQRSIRRKVAKALRKAADSASAQVENRLAMLGKGVEADAQFAVIARQIATDLDLGDIAELADAIYDDLLVVITEGAGQAIAQLGRDDATSLVDQVHERAVQWARARGAELVSGVDENTRARIASVIEIGLAENIGSPAIAEEIAASTAFSPERAELIAGTETATANGQGKLEGWREGQTVGLTILKSWLTTDDDCCDECSDNEAAGQIALDEDFPSGDDAEPAHPGCRCVTIAEVQESAGDEQGDDSGEDDA